MEASNEHQTARCSIRLTGGWPLMRTPALSPHCTVPKLSRGADRAPTQRWGCCSKGSEQVYIAASVQLALPRRGSNIFQQHVLRRDEPYNLTACRLKAEHGPAHTQQPAPCRPASVQQPALDSLVPRTTPTDLARKTDIQRIVGSCCLSCALPSPGRCVKIAAAVQASCCPPSWPLASAC